jgi:hypothetical protein
LHDGNYHESLGRWKQKFCAARAGHGVGIADGQGRPRLHLVNRHAAERIANSLGAGLADSAFNQAAICRSKRFWRRGRVSPIAALLRPRGSGEVNGKGEQRDRKDERSDTKP